jgi:pilus assembly protein CpaB
MRRPAIFVLFAVVAAMVAAIVVYSALKRREAEVQHAMVQSVNIVVAAKDLPIGTALDASSLKTVRWSRDSLPPGAIMNPSSVIGQYTKTAFVESEPIVTNRLFNGTVDAGILPLLIPTGMRAMSVPVDEVSDIAGFVLPHTHVDVLVSLSQGDKTVSRIVLQDVEVLAIAQEIEKVNNQPEPVRVVTVLVTPQQAERLTLATREGTLRLAMRNYNDKQIVSTNGIDLTQMMGDNSPPPAPGPLAPMPVDQPPIYVAPPRPRPQPVEVEILRDGRTSESIAFIRGHSHSSGAPPPAPSSSGPAGAGSPSLGAPDSSNPDEGASPSDSASPPDDSSPSDMISAPGAAVNTRPLGALSAPPGSSTATAGVVGGAAPPAVLLPPPAAADSASGFTGPRSHTIDVP